MFDGRLLSKEEKNSYRIIGQVFETYWLIEQQNQLFFMDQHAAHEKVLYEKIMKRLQKQEYYSQMVNPPILFTLSMKEEERLARFQSYFKKIGFEIEHFGGKEYAIRAVPDDLLGIAQKEIFLELLDGLAEEVRQQNISDMQVVCEKVARMSCRAAIKGRSAFSVQEAESLLQELMTLENPYHCPHGRPTLIMVSKYELEKKFKRV